MKIKGYITAAIAIVSGVCAAMAQAPMKMPAHQKIAYVERAIEELYVDTVNTGHLADEAIIAMLRSLDPHSTYTDAEATRALTEPLDGNFSGIGIQFNMLDDTIRVIQTVAGGPSEAVGILPGDRIMRADTTRLSGVKMPQATAMKHLRGPKGSEVTIEVMRRGEPEPLRFLIVRDDIPTNSIDAYYMLTPDAGYIKLTLFGQSTVQEMADAIRALRKQGMKHLVIDLEDNSGGYLGAAVGTASLFLPKGSPVVATEGRAAPRTTYEADGSVLMPDGRLVVAVNQFSASAAEILAGALQDNDRAVIVGRRTFGKGLVQRPIPFPDGSMVRLTTQRYYTPSGRSIQKPYSMGDEDAYNDDMNRRYQAGEFSSADSIHFPDSLRRTTLRLERPVYGGGGIMPDHFVGIDTTYYSAYYRNLVSRAVLNRYVNSYADNHRPELKSTYTEEKQFIDGFEVTDAMLGEIDSLARTLGVRPDSAGMAVSAPAIKLVVKGLLGRDLFEQGAYYRSAGSLNPIYSRAVEIIADRARYEAILRRGAAPVRD